MAVKKKRPSSTVAAFFDKDTPFEHRVQLLMHLCMDGSPQSREAVRSLLDFVADGNGETVYKKKCQELEAVKQQILDGPLRSGTFMRILCPGGSGNGTPSGEFSLGPLPRARVLTEDGSALYPSILDEKLVEELRCGEEVLLDAAGKTLLYRSAHIPDIGEEARLERRVGSSHVEVSLRDFEKYVFRASADLEEELDASQITPGDMLLVSSRRWMAFKGIPHEDKLSHFRFLCKDPVPNVDVDRDIGAPPKFIRELEHHVLMEMTRPELRLKYNLMRCQMLLLTGVSGSGKSLCIQGLWRRLFEVMSGVIGVDVADLPPRVLRLRASSVLSKWYSESEKQLDQFFDEVEQLADETFVGPDGIEYELPLLVIGEEMDGLARARGTDAVHDRVQTTLLQRLDATTQKLREKLIIFIFSTNFPGMVDPAFLRRAGGKIVQFDRLSQRACSEVLDKHLRDLPIRTNGKAEVGSAAVIEAKGRILPWLYSANGDEKGLVEITYTGATEPDVKYRRNFLTGALIARGIQEASEKGRLAEWNGELAGVTPCQIISALSRQIQSIVDQLHPHNVDQYVTVPDGVRVANLRRIPQPKIQPHELSSES